MAGLPVDVASDALFHGLSFKAETPLAPRVAELAPQINNVIELHDAGELTVGVEAFQEAVLNAIYQAGLMDKDVWLDTVCLATHPDNREKAMLVPIDVRDLLRRMAADGWSWKKWNALVCQRVDRVIKASTVYKKNEFMELADLDNPRMFEMVEGGTLAETHWRN